VYPFYEFVFQPSSILASRGPQRSESSAPGRPGARSTPTGYRASPQRVTAPPEGRQLLSTSSKNRVINRPQMAQGGFEKKQEPRLGPSGCPCDPNGSSGATPKSEISAGESKAALEPF